MKRIWILMLCFVCFGTVGCVNYRTYVPYPQQYPANYPQYPQGYGQQYPMGYAEQYSRGYAKDPPVVVMEEFSSEYFKEYPTRYSEQYSQGGVSSYKHGYSSASRYDSLLTQPIMVYASGKHYVIEGYDKLMSVLQVGGPKVFTFIFEEQYYNGYNQNITQLFELLGYTQVDAELAEAKIVSSVPGNKGKKVVRKERLYRQMFVDIHKHSEYLTKQQYAEMHERSSKAKRYQQQERAKQKTRIHRYNNSSSKKVDNQSGSSKPAYQNSALYRKMQEMGVEPATPQ